ncbi:MAG: ATP-binding protein [Christensenellales bacterium]
MRTIKVFFGGYGSGKTELSINTALNNLPRPTALADIDIVNPFFRSSERRALLEEQGVKVIAPMYALTNIDSPVLPPALRGLLMDKTTDAVIDAGGDPVGAAALGGYHEYLDGKAEMLFVINTMRPLTSTYDDIMYMLSAVQSRARVEATGLINNTNLATHTTARMLLKGREVIEKVSAKSGVPIKFVSGTKAILDEYKALGEPEAPLMPINIYMRPEWLDSTE